MAQSVRCSRGFTLVELLVVIAVIALLIGILVPALSGARAEAQAVQVAANVRTVAQGVAVYTADDEFFPPAYVYGAREEGGSWREQDQRGNNPVPANGYVHWSWSLFAEGDTPEDSFKSPVVLNGGAPRTNPGQDPDNWEPWQVNDVGSRAPGPRRPEDRQAARVAFTGNAAIFPRNKFNAGGQRQNRLVNPAWVKGPARTILATEFTDVLDWQGIRDDGNICKSHRPVTPFGCFSGDPFSEPNRGSSPRFFYPNPDTIREPFELTADLIADGTTTGSTLNAVGRPHSGGADDSGGTTQFSFVDGHVERITLIESIRDRKWGDKFYSLTGVGTEVDPDEFIGGD